MGGTVTTLVDSLWNFIGLKHPSRHKGKVVDVVYHALPPSPVIECCCFFLVPAVVHESCFVCVPSSWGY